MSAAGDLPPNQRARRDAALAGRAVAADLLADARLVAWAAREGRLVRIDRAPWRSPLRTPRDGGEAAVRDWYRWHFLPYRPGLVRRLPALRGKVLAHAGSGAGAHAAVLVAAANRSRRGADE